MALTIQVSILESFGMKICTSYFDVWFLHYIVTNDDNTIDHNIVDFCRITTDASYRVLLYTESYIIKFDKGEYQCASRYVYEKEVNL